MPADLLQGKAEASLSFSEEQNKDASEKLLLNSRQLALSSPPLVTVALQLRQTT